MKKEYFSPEFEYQKVTFITDALVVSDPQQTTPTGSGAEQSDPTSDPFGDF